ncbi:MAG: helix-hairpin-helix domain-containing protein [Paludibacteraceae bacterium]|nr:helix-hairpin-helix domain-containing protein [Paludibacteraceae bacterium]
MLICINANAQENFDLTTDIEFDNYDSSVDFMSDITSEVEDMKIRLSEIVANPININTATREELEDLPFLSFSQVENLLEYIFDYGQFKTIYELCLIDGFDKETVRLCLPFFKVEPAVKKHYLSFKNVKKYGKSNLSVQSGGTLQKKEGYNKGKYLGHPYSLNVRYSFKHKDFSVGFLGAKSEGEPFDFKYNKGFDFYSAHLAFLNISEYLKGIILGDYRLSFGQGLVFKSNKLFNSASINNGIVISDNIKPSYSKSETGYFRGAAMQFGGKTVNLSLFTSHTQYNKNEGYHRTISDFEKSYSTTSYLLGGNLSFSGRHVKIGFSGYYDFADKMFNIGLDYRLRIKRFNFTGEFALDKNMRFATIHSVSAQCSDILSMSLLLRYYGKDFYTKYGNAYSRNSLKDETGIMLTLEFLPFRNWKWLFSADVFSIDFIKSTIKKPSAGFNFNFKATYSPSGNNIGYIKYNVLSKETNLTGDDKIKKTGLYYKHNIIMNYNVTFKEQINFRATLASSVYTLDSLNNNKHTSYGFLLSAGSGWQMKNRIFGFNIGASFFDIPQYDNRIYNYEPSNPFNFSSIQYYGIGCRFYLLFKINPIKNMSISTKINHTYYVDRQEIGSGNEQIAGPRKTEIKFTLNYKF